ncbi:hypothetical protein EV681_2899 [Advenella incenata]|jgi:hypothetical protein|uniref:Uncharacterized protein n=1 Tax=Advenella incenata TaxID=267800 RepID=A0A4V2FSJ1_9BURK|nr:hypothetical protein [Advenella incenata]RZT94479.1 hypothetical protein EV681_2899 [Advenella incenata]
MARFKGNAHDVYEQNADFIHEKSTLKKTVDKSSEHFHKSNISWTSDADITLNSPEVEETYNTAIYRKNFSLYAYALKGLINTNNLSFYGYSKNKSYFYLNLSGVTTNTGAFFILPGPNLFYSGAIQIKVSVCTIEANPVGKELENSQGRSFIVDPKGSIVMNKKTTVDDGTTTTTKNSSNKYLRSKKWKHFGGVYIRRVTIQNNS